MYINVLHILLVLISWILNNIHLFLLICIFIYNIFIYITSPNKVFYFYFQKLVNHVKTVWHHTFCMCHYPKKVQISCPEVPHCFACHCAVFQVSLPSWYLCVLPCWLWWHDSCTGGKKRFRPKSPKREKQTTVPKRPLTRIQTHRALSVTTKKNISYDALSPRIGLIQLNQWTEMPCRV